MHIYLYLRHFPAAGSPLIGGTTKAVHGFAGGLTECGASVTVLCENDETSHVRQSKAGYLIRAFKPHRYGVLFPSPDLLAFVRFEMQPGLAILNGMFHPSLPALARGLAEAHVPYLVAPHTPYAPYIFRKAPVRKWLYWLARERSLLRNAHGVQVLSPAHARLLRNLNVRTPTLVVPNGFDADGRVDIAAPPRVRGSIRLFFFGRLDPHGKGLDLLIDAFARLCSTEDATLTLQGPGGTDAIEQLTLHAQQRGIAEHVSFLEPDYVTPPPTLMSQYDICCLPSRCEGMSLSSIEAMLAERVLMVSDIDGIAPHVEASQCGVVVRPTASSVWRGLRILVARRSQWPRMGRQGHLYARSHLCWREIAQDALSQYNTLCTRSNPVSQVS